MDEKKLEYVLRHIKKLSSTYNTKKFSRTEKKSKNGFNTYYSKKKFEDKKNKKMDYTHKIDFY